MPPIPAADAAPCTLCGRPWTELDGGSRWLHLEVTHGDHREGLHYLDADFCSQEHAAEWLDRPLPEPEPEVPYRMSRRGRLTGAAVGLAGGGIAALTVLGLVTAVRWVSQLL